MNTLLIQRLHQVKNVRHDSKITAKPEDATIGIAWFIDDKGVVLGTCVTLENGGASSAEVNKDRRIMPGIYSLQRQVTKVPLPTEAKQKGYFLTTKEDSKFNTRGIYIHAGNYPQDTLGCILLGSSYDFTSNSGKISGSMRAVARFYEFINAKGCLNVQVIIKDEHELARIIN